jgi:carboxyl-terminal processing protease
MINPARRHGRITLVLLLALAGCGSSLAPVAPGTPEQQALLFEEAFGGIAKYYIEPVSPSRLALAGLGHLSSIDDSLSVAREGDAVVLKKDDVAVAQFATPRDDGDAVGWGDLTDKIAEEARARSSALAALSLERLGQTVIDGSVGSLDRFSHYAPPDLAKERRASRDGFGGIGVTLNTEGADIRVVEILPETPAASAGLHVDDRILAIDGVETASVPREDVVNRLRGPADSPVTLAVARTGTTERLSFAMHRARIVPPSVTLAVAKGIARLRITSFNQQTGQSAEELLRQAHSEFGAGLRGIILDLRGNPGGLLDQAIEVASLFLDGAPVSSTVGRVPESIQYFNAPHREVEKLPMAVLVNGGSASASEIVAAALQDGGRAVVVGSSSFGKGTVQNVQRMPNEGELTITWARLYTPGGYVLHEHGVVPTICTVNAGDAGAALARSTGDLAAALDQPRAKLDDLAWERLRRLCPGQRDDHDVEVRSAEKLLNDPALYARVLALSPMAQRPVATASARVIR